jgi:hypothetical protein
LSKLNELDFAMTGVGAGDIVPPLRAGDNFLTVKQVAQAKRLGAVGALNLRYIAEEGEPVNTDFEIWSSVPPSTNCAGPIADSAWPPVRRSTARSGPHCWAGGSTHSSRTPSPLSGSQPIEIDQPRELPLGRLGVKLQGR